MRQVVLDFDGPIVDVERRHFTVYSDICNALRIQPLARNEYWDLKRVPSGARIILRRSGAERLYPEFARRWLQEIEKPSYLALDTLQKDAQRILERWRLANNQLILATMRQSPNALRTQLEDLGIADTFDQIVVCDRMLGAAGKANAVSHHVGAAPTGAVWIGDTELDIAAARERDCKSWAVSSGLRSAEYLLTQHPDRLSKSLSTIDLDEI